MKQQLKALAAGACIVAIATVCAAAQANKIDLTGKWVFTVQTDAGTGEPTVTLKQDGEKLTGHYSSQVLGEADLTGTVKGQQIQFTFTANAQGTSLEVKYSGTIENKDALKGSVDLGGLGSGTFTAKRQ
jgi:hypothetical protein